MSAAAIRLRRAIRVDRVTAKTLALNRQRIAVKVSIIDAPLLWYWERLIPGLCFRQLRWAGIMVSRGSKGTIGIGILATSTQAPPEV